MGLVTSSKKKLPIELQNRVQADHIDIHVTKTVQYLFCQQMEKATAVQGKHFGGICKRVVAETMQQNDITPGESGKQHLMRRLRKMTLKRHSHSNRNAPEYSSISKVSKLSVSRHQER